MPGDECVLMGNTTDKNRQNLILISATEDGQPRIDVLDGVHDKNFTDCLRARLGNLDGITDDMFPADNQPHGNGLYSDNAYLRGTFLLVTGEDIKTKFEIVEGKIESMVEAVRNDFVTDKGYLSNPAFATGMEKWDTQNEAVFFLVGNKWIWANNNVLTRKGNCASVTKDDGRTVVRIVNKYILQKNPNLRSKPMFATNAYGKKEALPVYLSFFYRCVKPGKLTVRFDSVDKTGFENFNSFDIEEELAETTGYVQFNCDGLWNGTGDFRLSFTGEIYLYMLVMSTDKVEALTYKYRTLFEQSEKLIKIAAQNFDSDGKVLEESGIMTTSRMTGMYAIDENGKLKAFVGAGQDGVKLKAENIELEGLVTANQNFRILEDGSIEANSGTFSGTIKSLFVHSVDCDAITTDKGRLLNTDLKIVSHGYGETFILPVDEKYLGSTALIYNPITLYSRTDQTTTIITQDESPILGIAPTDGAVSTDGQQLGVDCITFLTGVMELICVPGDIISSPVRWCVLNSSAYYLYAPKPIS